MTPICCSSSTAPLALPPQISPAAALPLRSAPMDLLGKPVNPNKRLKEEFVSNLTGSSMLEIAALTAIVPALFVIRQWSSFARVNGHVKTKEAVVNKNDNATSCTRDWRNYTVALAMDYLCVVLPVLLVFTVLAEWVYACTILVTLLLLFCILARRRRFNFHFNDGSQHLSSFRTYISSYRVSVMLVTCLCILAVDFKIFPRRYAKTETYGTGLMDVGVGLFVVTNSIVSRQARNSMSMNWKAAFQSISPLILLGFGRLIFTTGVDYQVHVGEYGVHWNFFFTLAAVTILTSIINIDPRYCGIFGLLILIAYQICLIHGLSAYLISNERTADIISQNKEGIFSVFGYWGMYLIGVHLGYEIFFGNHSSSTAGNIQRARVRVWTLSALFWFLTIVLDNYVERVSRRMCNLAYVMMVFAQTFQVLSILMLSDFTFVKKPLVLEEAFNQNMLGTFLLANVLTGMVNLSVDTLSASSFAAIGILLGYSIILTAVVGLAWFYGIKLKVW